MFSRTISTHISFIKTVVMRKNFALSIPILTVGLVSTVFQSLAFAGNLAESFQTAQLTNQCRQVNQDVSLYENASVESVSAGFLRKGTEVNLAQDRVIGGWIAVDTPVAGFLRAMNLAPCGSYPVPAPSVPTNVDTSVGVNVPTEVCINYRVSQEDGLEVYESDNQSSPVIDYVFPTEKVKFTQASARGDVEWLNITAPIEGWIENGILGSDSSNTSSCSELGISYNTQQQL